MAEKINDYEEFFKSVEDSLFLQPHNIDRKIYDAPNIQNNLIRRYIVEKTKLLKLESKLDRLTGEKYHYYRYESDLRLENKDVAMLYVKKDNDYIKVVEEYGKQKIIVEMVDKFLKKAMNIGYDIKNIIDYLKFMNGEK